MTSKRRPYKTYPREFKLEAVRMMDTSDRPAFEIESELGIRRNLLYKWKVQIERKGEANLNSERGRPSDNLLVHPSLNLCSFNFTNDGCLINPLFN